MSTQKQLVGAEDCIKIVFPCETSRPGLRTYREWQARGYFPFHKIGRRTFFDPEEVRAALVFVFGVGISCLELQWGIIITIFGLIAGQVLINRRRDPHEDVLREFAKAQNWYHDAGTELRSVSGQRRRVRFYTQSLLSIREIIHRLMTGDFAPRAPQPAGEVPRKRPTPRERSFSEIHKGPQVERMIPAPVENSPFIPPAGWNPNPVTPFVLDESSMSPAGNDQVEPAAEEIPPPASQVRASRCRSVSESPEPASKGVTNLSPAPEGGRKPRTNYAVVRSSKLREAAIAIHGRNCIACGKNFDEIYGAELAKGYIEVHHLSSIATGLRTTDPATDLVPLCSNCHKMADRLKPPPRTIGDLKSRLFPTA